MGDTVRMRYADGNRPPSRRLRHHIDVAEGSLRVLTELGAVHRLRARSGLADDGQVLTLPCGWRVDDDGVLLPEVDDLEMAIDQRPAGKAGKITGWSAKSRIRMMYRLTTLDWDAMRGIPEMLTLTYPGEFPTSGAIVKEHLRRFRIAWEREFKAPPAGVWKLEFQRRGAPHFHLYVGRPTSLTWQEFAGWASLTWYRIVGSGDERHLRAGVGVDRQFCSRAKSVKALAWYFAKHNAKHSTKHYQNEVPAGFEDVGRFWGYWTLEPKVTRVELSTQEFVEVRRLLARLRQSKTGKRRSAPSRLIGLWALTGDGFDLAARVLMRRVPTSSYAEWSADVDQRDRDRRQLLVV